LENAASGGYHCRLKEQNMKRALLLVLILLLAAAGAFAAPPDFTTFQAGFSQFAQDLANGAPFNASTGLNWSPAYIGQFPHFGIGVTVGATTIPAAAINQMASALGVTLPSQFSYFQQSGVPVPAYTIDARLGGFALPFDIGLKVGYIPPGALQQMGLQISADYLLIGGDVRYALLQDKGFVPAISIGIGYNYLKESVGVPQLLPGSITIANIDDGSGPHPLVMSNPSLGMAWSTNVLEAKAQISKRILFITPYLGGAISYSFGASANGTVTSSMTYNGSPLTQTDINNINAYYQGQGQTPPDLTTTSISANAASGAGFDYRVFGGLSLDLFILYVDLGGAYDFSTSAWGASVNLRIAI
jgi:hypothetical protein